MQKYNEMWLTRGIRLPSVVERSQLCCVFDDNQNDRLVLIAWLWSEINYFSWRKIANKTFSMNNLVWYLGLLHISYCVSLFYFFESRNLYILPDISHYGLRHQVMLLGIRLLYLKKTKHDCYANTNEISRVVVVDLVRSQFLWISIFSKGGPRAIVWLKHFIIDDARSCLHCTQLSSIIYWR